eukprot:SAG11_NODE_177_length_13334_cov_9.614280_3_plen_88_part_00
MDFELTHLMASAAEERAMVLITKAEKKLKGMFSFGNGKFEEAAELYAQAAKQYQLAKNCASYVPCNRAAVRFSRALLFCSRTSCRLL